MNKQEEPNEHRIVRAQLRAAVTNLINAANRNNTAVVGFVFGSEPPIIIRFGNTTESGPALAALYLKLADVAEEKEMLGLVINDPIKPESN